MSPSRERPGASAASGDSKTVKKSQHRPDIDGLRALAVLPVVAFHAGIHLVRGGFVGVDVFFVISGFLITQLLVADIRADRFSIVNFYERRIRRILPALMVMMVAVCALGARYLLPGELIDLSKSAIAASLSASNILFWQQAGYFDGPALSKPLLHTWSLAVEEQFYIFWPLLLYLGDRYFNHRLTMTLVVVTVLSFIASAIGAFTAPSATFYLPFTRIWELSGGGLIALGLLPRPSGAVLNNLLAVSGLGLIIGSVFLIDQSMPFPGLLALPPCLGAILLIYCGQWEQTLVGRALSLAPLVFIGVISYSLYLWHWPIVVFQRGFTFLHAGLSDHANKALIIGASLVVAVASWAFVEQPFRQGRWRPARAQLMRMALAATVIVVTISALLWSADGLPRRFNARQLQIASLLQYNADSQFRTDTCFLSTSTQRWVFAPNCLQSSTTKPNVLIFGDSHAAQFRDAFSQAYPERNFLQATVTDCFPTVVHALSESRRCVAVVDDMFARQIPQLRDSQVYLIARWKSELLPNIAATLDWFAQRHIAVTLFGPSPLYDSPLPRLLVTAVRSGESSSLAQHLDGSVWDLDRAMSALVGQHGAHYVSLMTLMCPGGQCMAWDAAQLPLLFDREHLTSAGAQLILERMRQQNALP